MNPLKETIVSGLLESGRNFMIVVARHIPGVVLPDDASELAPGAVGLMLGNNLPVPIPDLLVDETGISATFSFNRVGHRVFVPWDALGSIHADDCVMQFRVAPPEPKMIVEPGVAGLRLVKS